MNMQGIENLATTLGEGYPAWIICSIIGYVLLMIWKFPGVYAMHTEEVSEDLENRKEHVHLVDPKQIKLDKILCFLAASVCFVTVSAIFSKIILFLLGLLLAFIAGFIYLGIGIVVVFFAIILFLIIL